MEKQKMKTASAVAAAVLLGAALVFAGCEGPVLDGPAPTGSEAGIGVSASSASVNLAPGSDPFTATHLAEFVPLDPAPDCYASTNEYTGYVDWYTFDDGGYYLIYNMSWYTPWEGYDVSGEIQYIKHFGDNVTVYITVPYEEEPIPFTGAAGVLIFEVDHIADDSENVYIGNGDFTAVYYYGGQPIPSVQNGITRTSNGGNTTAYTLTNVQLGMAAVPNPDTAENAPDYATPCYDDLQDAIDAFASIASLEEYIKEPAEPDYEKRDFYSLP